MSDAPKTRLRTNTNRLADGSGANLSDRALTHMPNAEVHSQS